ncbi:kinase-like domain-containing protein, partial [Zopfochytrium polystomum]
MVLIHCLGYDDSHGDYYLTMHDHIAYRYEILALLGKGSFGQVARCFDHKTKKYVAVKIIRNKKRFEKQGVVEVKVLDKVRREDGDGTHNMIHMFDSFYFRHHLCITFELLGTNLYEWIKAGNFRGVHSGVIKRFALQIIEGLVLLKRNRIVHCDLKPENILLKDIDFNPASPNYEIKLIDFGSSCFEHEKVYTYVQSRFYRSPEVILGISYTMAIDMWSVGCILAELLTGYPLFAGENENEQLACIMEIKGLPPPDLVSSGSRRQLFFESNGQPRPYTNSKGKRRRPGAKNLTSALRIADPVFADFIDKCLEWDPARRMTPEQALRHEWL